MEAHGAPTKATSDAFRYRTLEMFIKLHKKLCLAAAEKKYIKKK